MLSGLLRMSDFKLIHRGPKLIFQISWEKRTQRVLKRLLDFANIGHAINRGTQQQGM